MIKNFRRLFFYFYYAYVCNIGSIRAIRLNPHLNLKKKHTHNRQFNNDYKKKEVRTHPIKKTPILFCFAINYRLS